VEGVTEQYPTDSQLRRIRKWDCVPADGRQKLMEFVRGIWGYADWGWHKEGGDYYISTGGWSGNESIIGALSRNFLFWSLSLQSHRAGGHYFFCLNSDHEHALCSSCNGTGLLADGAMP